MAKRLEIQFFNENTSESISLPINPASVSLPHEMNTNTYNIIGFGEINKIGDRKLKTASFENLFPDDDSFILGTSTFFSSVLSDIFSVLFTQSDTIEKMKRWEYDKDIIRVIVSDHFNEVMQISSFTPTYPEDSSWVVYNINFIEYRDPEALSSSSLPQIMENGLLARSVIRAIPSTVVANQADDLYSLATKFTGDGANWTNLASLNGITDGSKSIVGKVISL